MPAKKQKTTLVTEDVLIEAVTERVTDQIRKDIDDRMARFEQALQRFTRPDEPQASDVSAEGRKAPPPPPAMSQTQVNLLNEQVCTSQPTAPQPQSGEAHLSNTATAARTPFAMDHQPPRPAIFAKDSASTSAQDVNINNDNNAWQAWLAVQQKPGIMPAAHHSNYVYPSSESYDNSLDAQVRHLLEATPHQLKGNSQHPPFPYKYVTRGLENKRLSVNTVTLAEHIYGMFLMMDDDRIDPSTKPAILEHMREVAEDACEFEWGGYVRRWSEEVFNLIAEKRLPGGWGATARIQNLRTGMSRVDSARLSKFEHPRSQPTANRDQPSRRYGQASHQTDPLRGGPPCKDFNSQHGCSLASGHMSQGKKQVHVCAYCLINTAAAHPHSEAHCRTKQRHANSHF